MSVPASRTRKRVLCRFNLHHKWVRRFDRDGGELYGTSRSRSSMLF